MSDLINISQFLCHTGKRNLALEVIDHFANYIENLHQLKDIADAYFQAHEFEKAIHYFKTILERSPATNIKLETSINLANLYLMQNNPKEALNLLNDLPNISDIYEIRQKAILMEKELAFVSETGFWDENALEHHGFSLDLAEWLTNYLDKSKKLYDFGCGLGNYLVHLKQNGFADLVGYEENLFKEQVFENIIQQDLTKKFQVPECGNVVCLEVGEHIPAKYQDAFLDNITAACDEKLILSWAIRGQQGFFHVNCLNNEEIIPEIEKRGFVFLESDSLAARKSIGSECDWFKNTILIFKKKS